MTTPRHQAHRVRRFLEWTGVDLLPILLGKALPQAVVTAPPSRQTLLDAFGSLDEERSKEVLAIASDAFARQTDRIAAIEAKATSLLGFAGAGLALGSSLALFMMDASHQLPFPLPHVARALFVLMLGSYVCAIALAMRVLDVTRYWITVPTTSDLSAAGQHTTQQLRALRNTDLVQSETQNGQVARDKATYLIGAQRWFRNAIAMVLLLASVLALQPLLHPGTPTAPIRPPSQGPSPPGPSPARSSPLRPSPTAAPRPTPHPPSPATASGAPPRTAH